MKGRAVRLIECDYCYQPLDGTACRWRCPRCGLKLNCCEGAPLAAASEAPPITKEKPPTTTSVL